MAHDITQMSGNVPWHMILLRYQGMWHVIIQSVLPGNNTT